MLAAVGLSVPFGLAVLWLLKNHGLPVSDAGDDFRIAYLMYKAFQAGPGPGLDFTLHTGGKPFLFSLFAVPFMPLARASVQLPSQTFLITASLALCLSCYWLFRYRLLQRDAAVLTAVVLTVPAIFQVQLRFMSEVMWVLWYVLFLGFLLRSEGLSKPGHTLAAGLFLALALLARPVESATILVPGLAIYLMATLAPTGQLVALLVATAVCAATLARAAWISFHQGAQAIYGDEASAVGAAALLSIAWWLDHKRAAVADGLRASAASGPFRFLVIPTILCGIWLSHYLAALYYWTFANTFGSFARVTDQANAGKSLAEIIYFVLNQYGTFTLDLLLAMAALSFMLLRRRWVHDKANVIAVVVAVFAGLLPMLVAYKVTGTSDPRRIFLGVFTVFVLLAFVIGRATALYPRTGLIFRAALVGVLIVQASAILGASLRNPKVILYPAVVGGLGMPWPQTSPAHDLDVVQRFLTLGIHRAHIAVFTLGLFTDRVTYETESLRYAALLKDPELDFRTCWAYARYEDYSKVIDRMTRTGFDYILLENVPDPFVDDAVMEHRMQPHTFFVRQVLQKIDRTGPSRLPRLELVDDMHFGDRTSYIFKIERHLASQTQNVRRASTNGLCY
jgi:4-amino-4-deoxy-L-arabinose transferase-like glycosyltransferase